MCYVRTMYVLCYALCMDYVRTMYAKCKNYVCMHYLCTMLYTMYGLFTNISNMFSILTILIKELLRKTKMFCISNLIGLILLFSFLWFNPKL